MDCIRLFYYHLACVNQNQSCSNLYSAKVLRELLLHLRFSFLQLGVWLQLPHYLTLSYFVVLGLVLLKRRKVPEEQLNQPFWQEVIGNQIVCNIC
jgi:hypothetical protein